MKTLTRSDILDANDLPREAVDVPEWGGQVYVRTLTSGQRDSLDVSLMVWRDGAAQPVPNLLDGRAKLLVRVLCDEDGGRLFSEGDIALLSDKSVKAVERVYAVAKRLNAMEASDVDELEGNSDADQPGGSASD